MCFTTESTLSVTLLQGVALGGATSGLAQGEMFVTFMESLVTRNRLCLRVNGRLLHAF